MSLLLNILSRLVITLIPKSKCLLISWLQSLSAVILEPPKIKSDTLSPYVLRRLLSSVWVHFHWVRQGCGPSVIRFTSFLWIWFQCVGALMPSCNTYHLTWVSLTLSVGYLFMAAPAKCSPYSSKVQPLLLTLDAGYLLTAALPDLQRGMASLGPPAPMQPLLLGCGVAPPGHRPWP